MGFKFPKSSAIKCALCAGIFVCLVFIIFSIYGVFFLKHVAHPHILIVDFVAPLLLIAALVKAFTLDINDQVQFLAFIASTVICLYLVEAILFVNGYYHDYQANIRQAQKEGRPFDERNLDEVILDLRSQGIPAFPSFMPRQFVLTDDQHPELSGGIDSSHGKIIPLGGVSHATIVCCNEGGLWVTYPSDEYGFNNPRGLYHQGLDMIALGDSYVEGHCVRPDENSIAFLRKSGKTALALGKAGNGPLAMLATFREYVEALKPKVVLWYYYEEDEMTFLGRERDTSLMNYLNPLYSQHLKGLQQEIDPRLKALTRDELSKHRGQSNYAKRSLVNYFLVFYQRVLFLKDLMDLITSREDPVEANLPLLKDVLKQVQDRVESWGGRVYFVYLPSYVRFDRDLSPEEQEHLFGRKKVLDMAQSLSLPVVDITPVFKGASDPLGYYIFRRHNHYTPQGYAVIADAVLQGIKG